MNSAGFYCPESGVRLFQLCIALELQNVLVFAILNFLLKVVFGLFKVFIRHVLTGALGVIHNEIGLLDFLCKFIRVYG